MATTKTKLAAAKKVAEKLKAKKSVSTKKTTTSSKATTTKKEKKETLSSVLSKQGQNRPQNPSSYTTAADKLESAQNVGWRWTEQGAKKLGKTLTSKPSPQDIKNYANKTFKIARKPNIASTSHDGDGSYRYLYTERRINKSDFNRKSKFEDGGMMAKGGKTKKYRYGVYTISEDGQKFEYDFFSDNPNLEDDVYGDDVPYTIGSNQTIIRLEDGGMMGYRKGGQTMGQHQRKTGVMDRAMDKDWMAKPVGWRYTNAKAKRLGVDEYSVPTDAHREKYRGKGVYFENRRDKSDKNPSMGYRRGGQTMGQHERKFGVNDRAMDKEWMAKPVGWRYTNARAKRLGVDEYSVPTDAHREKYRGKGVYFENRRDKSDKNPSMGYRKGGQTMGQNESQFGWRNQKDDKFWMAKPVGWRYTDARARKLGVDEYSVPSLAHIDKYKNKGVYYERRRDKSDRNPSKGY